MLERYVIINLSITRLQKIKKAKNALCLDSKLLFFIPLKQHYLFLHFSKQLNFITKNFYFKLSYHRLF